MYGLTTINKLNREAAEADAIMAKYDVAKGTPVFDAVLEKHRAESDAKLEEELAAFTRHFNAA